MASLSGQIASEGRGFGGQCMVMVSDSTFSVIAYWKKRVTRSPTEVVNEKILSSLDFALERGQLYTYSLSREQYSIPVSIVSVNSLYQQFEVEVRPNEIRLFGFEDICSTRDLLQFNQ